jgi:hypothetical protein
LRRNRNRERAPGGLREQTSAERDEDVRSQTGASDGRHRGASRSYQKHAQVRGKLPLRADDRAQAHGDQALHREGEEALGEHGGHQDGVARGASVRAARGSSGREGSGRARSETPAEGRASPRAQVRSANAVRRNAPEAGRMVACASRDACGAPSARRDKSRRGRARGSSARLASALATTTTYREGKKGSF